MRIAVIGVMRSCECCLCHFVSSTYIDDVVVRGCVTDHYFEGITMPDARGRGDCCFEWGIESCATCVAVGGNNNLSGYWNMIQNNNVGLTIHT
mmetsp:Transcript_4002/g.9102  ORF Transcript_4002/g.9102 Transcript_4002/m.9102 type:complete len:93 (+) Transcript_4002:124-402(+)